MAWFISVLVFVVIAGLFVLATTGLVTMFVALFKVSAELASVGGLMLLVAIATFAVITRLAKPCSKNSVQEEQEEGE